MYKYIENFLFEQNEKNGEGLQPLFFNGEHVVLEDEDKTKLYIARRDFIINDINNINNKKIVDFGCNVGFDGLEFSRNGANVTFVDVDSNMINLVKFLAIKEKLNVETINASYIEFLFKNEQYYDIFFLFSIFSYSSIESCSYLLKIIMDITEIAYIDLSPERKYQPFDITERKKFQDETLYKFCNDYLKEYFYDILENDYSYIIKVSKKKNYFINMC